MSPDLRALVDSLAGRRVLVIGEAMLDSYLRGTTDRLCQEAPVPIVAVGQREDAPGGAANAALNVHALGGQVRFLSAVGDDPEAGTLREALTKAGIAADDVLVEPGRRTLAKHRVVAGGQLLIRFDQGDTAPVGPETEAALVARLAELYPSCDAAIVSDYGYGIVTPGVIRTLGDLQARYPRLLAVDSKQLAVFRGVGVTAVKPNYGEAVRLLGGPAPEGFRTRADGIAARADALLETTGAQIAAVTLDAEGALILERGRPIYRTYARPRAHARAAGAGDTFLGAFALALAAGAHTPASAELASAAAALVVSHEGTTACSAAELGEYLATGDGDKYQPDPGRLAARLELYRRQGRRVVFTNGCFDILHRGHITFLSRAKALGDVLVVGINSDAGVRRLKGASRPINRLEDRVGVLAALSCVDHVVPFDEDEPSVLLRAIRPDVFAKGGDYTRERLPEADLVEELGGVLQILPYLQDHSTTGIVERVRASDPPSVRRPVST
jgi:D-beta-D-heptose 7-phosphate kinase / D-beta-D-heptose 1-phosphate adenosyltransferase